MPSIPEIADQKRTTQSLASSSTQGRAIVSDQSVSERDKKMVEMLCDGHTLEQIATRYGTTVRAVQTAAERQAVLLNIELSRPENKEAAIGIELSKIDRLAAFWEYDATYGKNIEAAKFMLTCHQEKAKRLNLYPATQSESKNFNINLEAQAQDMIHAGKNELLRFVNNSVKNIGQEVIEAETEVQEREETTIVSSTITSTTPTSTKK